MWLATKIGFFSVVLKAGSIHVRSRSDLELFALQTRANSFSPVLADVGTDYKYRMIMSREQFTTRIMPCLADTVDYSNFKEMVQTTPSQQPKLGAYTALYHALIRVDDSERRCAMTAAQPLRGVERRRGKTRKHKAT